MCADISGFTALSEKHCKKGTAGLDTLVQVKAGCTSRFGATRRREKMAIQSAAEM